MGAYWRAVSCPAPTHCQRPARRRCEAARNFRVYALYDALGRLLYVGKARNVRSRVRSHLRGKSGASFFQGWTRQIARIAIRLADSELEALLLEAEMIRSLQPAYNRQMRRWAAYCYLCANGSPHGQLEIRAEPASRAPCFGPFRSRFSAQAVYEEVTSHFALAMCTESQTLSNRQSLLPQLAAGQPCRRYFEGSCGGPCGGRISHAEYDGRIRRRDALLLGLDDTSVRELETQVESLPPDSPEDAIARLTDLAQTLRSVSITARPCTEPKPC